MRYGIISDIHGNLEALEAAKKALSRESIDRYLCVGDIVGYGANPSECVKETRKLGAIAICGNHDAAASGLIGTSNFNEAARNAVIWTAENMNPEDIVFLKGLDLVYKNKDLTMVHGTLKEPGLFHYMFDAGTAPATLDLMRTQTCFIGHTHIPGIFVSRSGKLSNVTDETLEISDDEKAIVNVGSIGQPRDGDSRLCYCIYDTDKRSIDLKRLSYDVKKAKEKILNAGLPSFLAHRLDEGI